MSVTIGISFAIISGILCALLEIIGVFGLSWGVGPFDSLPNDCLFFFPLPLCLISLGSLRWATALMWINLIVLCIGYLSLGGTYFNPFNSIVSAIPFSAVLLYYARISRSRSRALERKYRPDQTRSLPL